MDGYRTSQRLSNGEIAAQWLKFTPHELVRAHLKIDESVLAKIPAQKTPVVSG